jgi:uncharacterized protein (UPF0332 family)
MKPEQLEDLLRYRMEQAQETLREAEILLNEDAWRGTVNRAYYAMFYALLALLATRQLGTSRHSGALSLFDREFVKQGVFPLDFPDLCIWPSIADRDMTTAKWSP